MWLKQSVKTLVESGAQVDVLPMREVKDLSAYDAVVAGSGINAGVWLPEAMEFMRAHQAELKQKPFAAFLVCMTLSMKNGEGYRSHVSTWLDPVRASGATGQRRSSSRVVWRSAGSPRSATG